MARTYRIDPDVKKEVSSKGGKSRAAKLSQARRTEIAQIAALARWSGRRVNVKKEPLPDEPLET